MLTNKNDIETLRRRADFLDANRGRRAVTPGFILLLRARDDADARVRLGITVSKKVGGAVVRNRMKRRLRVLGRRLLPEHGQAGADHVLIGRPAGIERPFAALAAELEAALAKVGRSSPPAQGTSASSSPPAQGPSA